MEAGEAGSRQSGTTSANHAPDRYEHHQHHQHPYSHPHPHPAHAQQQQHQQPPREPQALDRHFREAPAMATATLISPTTPYPGHPHSFTSGYPHATTGPSVGGMISPVEPRRPSDDTDAPPPPPRQSLPSISEVISSARSEYPPQSAPTTLAPGPAPAPASSFSSPFSSTPRPHPHPEAPIEKGPSPRPLQPTASTYPPNQQPLPAFADSPRARQFGGGRPGPPPIVGPYSAPHPSPPMKLDPLRPESDKPPEPHHVNGGYPPSHPHPPVPMSYQNPAQLPPGQLPLSAAGYPVSPRHAGPPPLPSPYDPQRTPRPEDEAAHARARYDMTVNRHFEAWNYQDCLHRIASGTRTIFNFAEGYSKIAQEQHSARPIPERLPTEREVNDMLNNIDYIKRSLESLRDVVQQSVRNEIQGKMKGPYEDEDVTMYDGGKPAFGGVSEVKKRRGRAAPPGRCHSCNRIDTPEWRRGPDGARTLCNACGLHYAKLERKRQLEARSIRPKGSDEQN